MTDEEMARLFIINKYDLRKDLQIWEIKKNLELSGEYQAFLAGLKAGRPQWHDLRKDPNDLPKDKHNVWCKCLDECGEGWYDKETDTWTLIYRGYHVHCIEAWCEIPTFDKE